MMKAPELFAIACLGLFLGSCSKPPQTGRGFFLPVGNATRGQTAFVQQKCHTCHTVRGVELPAPSATNSPVVQLGGDVTRLRSYGDLVTAIIYPSHSISDLVSPGKLRDMKVSPMPDVTDTMTVAQLVDVVTFLQPKYSQVIQTTYGYGYPVPQ